MKLAPSTVELPAMPKVLDLPLRDRPRTLPPEVSEWAVAADSRFRACVELRPSVLPGIRIGVKDTVDVAGFATRLGLRYYRHYPSTSARVLNGVPTDWINAKLTTTELSIGLEHGCVSPYFPHLDPGGSSTGCAVAVAANICDLAMGTDSVASVRLPAGACGVVGLRLTHDRGLLSGLFRLSEHLDAPGWLTRTVADLGLAWDVFDLSGRGAPPVPASGRWRLGIVTDSVVDEMEPAVARSFQDLVTALRDAGHDLVNVRLGELFSERGLAYQLCAAEAASGLFRFDAELSASTRRALELGAAIGDARLTELVARHHELRTTARKMLADSGLDAWLLPAGTLLPRNIFTEPAPESTIPKLPAGSSPHVNYAAMAAFLGLPALSFPVDYSPEHDAPVTAQLVGPEWTEARLIAVARDITDCTAIRPFRVAEAGR